jgi:hypothetical protein
MMPFMPPLDIFAGGPPSFDLPPDTLAALLALSIYGGMPGITGAGSAALPGLTAPNWMQDWLDKLFQLEMTYASYANPAPYRDLTTQWLNYLRDLALGQLTGSVGGVPTLEARALEANIDLARRYLEWQRLMDTMQALGSYPIPVNWREVYGLGQPWFMR